MGETSHRRGLSVEWLLRKREAHEAERPAGIPTGYQPALDGIRAVAVMMVVCYHLGKSGGSDLLGGGWLGVDVFFVLSGYLIRAL